MCGIAGFIGGRWDGAEAEDRLVRMTGAIAHRGPDDVGTWCDADARVALGHRRLSIVDLSHEGHQPKASASGRWMIVFNGEIYNFRTLRAELEALGATCRGHSDTEVMLAAIEAWGLDAAVRRFAGMFAFAVWDREERALHLVRDRMGEKPLYYGRGSDGALLFGSELKAMRAYPGWSGEVDRGVLAAYLRFNYVPGPYSIYAGVRKLPPGHRAVVRADAREPELHRYWSIEEAARTGREAVVGDEDASVDGLDAVLRTVVAEEMVADVPLGAFLSGGIDSSLIVALMQAQSARPVRTFTIGFAERAYNEAEHAKAIARHLGTEHTELYVTPEDLLGVVPRLPVLYDEPFADSSQVPTFLVAQLARQHVTVALSGDGGDELFGGYNRYFWGRRLWSWLGRAPRPARRAAAAAIRAVPPQRWDSVASSMRPLLPAALRGASGPGPGDRLHKLAGILAVREPLGLYRQLVSLWDEPERVVLGAREAPTRVFAAAPLPGGPRPASFVEQMMVIDTETYLPDDILVKVDRASMGVSLETRAPFLDHRVAEYAWKLPLDHKVQGGQGKRVVQRLLHRYVPREMVERPKMGFGIPLDSWLRGPLRDWADDLLSPDRLRRDGYFDVELVSRRWSEHRSGTRNWQYALWGVLMFQAWHDAQ
jgi:asparagine synthase (glutamine-hydrolysing)